MSETRFPEKGYLVFNTGVDLPHNLSKLPNKKTEVTGNGELEKGFCSNMGAWPYNR